jgi:hypothetical protein
MGLLTAFSSQRRARGHGRGGSRVTRSTVVTAKVTVDNTRERT